MITCDSETLHYYAPRAVLRYMHPFHIEQINIPVHYKLHANGSILSAKLNSYFHHILVNYPPFSCKVDSISFTLIHSEIRVLTALVTQNSMYFPGYL